MPPTFTSTRRCGIGGNGFEDVTLLANPDTGLLSRTWRTLTRKNQRLSTRTSRRRSVWGCDRRSTNDEVLNEMLRVSHHAYNWCNFLVRDKGFKANAFDLMKVVSKTNSIDVPREFRMEEGDDWFFDNRMTDIKRTSCKNFTAMYKSARTNQKKSTVSLRDKELRVFERR